MAIQFLLFVYFFVFLLDTKEARGQQLYNVTVNDDSPTIQYLGDWKRTLNVELGMTYMVAQEANATALVEFQGVAIFFFLPLLPYDVTTQIQLDSQPPLILQQATLNTPIASDENRTAVASQVVWGVEGLDNRPVHRLEVSVAPFSQLAILNGLIITRVNESSSLPPSQTTTPVTGNSGTGYRVRNLTTVIIGIGVGITLVILAVFLSFTISMIRKRRARLMCRPRGTLRVDLESDFPPIPKLCFSSFLPQHSCSRSTAASSQLEAPEGTEFFMQSRQIQHPSSVHLVYSNFHCGKFDQPPPGYYESISSPSIKLDHAGYFRISRLYDSAPRNSHLAPLPPSFDSIASGSHAYFLQHEYSPSRTVTSYDKRSPTL